MVSYNTSTCTQTHATLKRVALLLALSTGMYDKGGGPITQTEISSTIVLAGLLVREVEG